VKIPLPDFLLELRSDAREQGLKTPGEIAAMKGYAAVMKRAGLLEATERIAGVLGQFFTKGKGISGLPYPFSGWTERRDFPAPAARPFRKQWKTRRGVTR
jgi:L-lactate dehydrogenase complex protein LldF